MSDVKVTFTIDSPKGKISFTELNEISQKDLKEKVLEFYLNWDKNAQETAILHLLKQELGQDQVKNFAVELSHLCVERV
ncbi:MAG: hypothetical protein KGZ96_10230 [Clostridia bacterium]|jgi:hypothetical protein|nr:hypothetical protein [Clostridia bacterium]